MFLQRYEISFQFIVVGYWLLVVAKSSKANNQMSECRSCPSFMKIQYSLIYDKPFDISINIHYWRIRFKNNYSVPVYNGFSFGINQ